MKKVVLILLVVIVFFFLWSKKEKKKAFVPQQVQDLIVNAFSEDNLIDKQGNTIATRVLLPKGYKRIEYANNSFETYLRNYKVKEFGTPIINYDGSEYFAQHWHDAILEVPVPKNGLQQCADALMRIRAEYLWTNNRKNEIGFKFTSGHYCSWEKYAQGYRPKINGNKVTFHQTASSDTSKANFYKYLNLIYTYAGTASLQAELPSIKIKDLKIGDMLVKPGFPGHIEIIVDAAVNEDGEKIFLLAQGNTPAQNVCLLKNLEYSSITPWYKFTNNKPVYTPSYYFDSPTFLRFK